MSLQNAPQLSKAVRAAVTAATPVDGDFEEKMRNHLACIVAPTPTTPAR